jgi:hypothetical protein
MDLTRLQEDSLEITDAFLREQHLVVGLNHGNYNNSHWNMMSKVLPLAHATVACGANIHEFQQPRVRMLNTLLISVLQSVRMLHHLHIPAHPDQRNRLIRKDLSRFPLTLSHT